MVKLNNKGMTAVEILVCMVLVVVITVSMYTSVSSYKNKQQIESFKEKIMTYKNLITKEINDDLIKDGLISAEITDFTEAIHNDMNNDEIPDRDQKAADSDGNGHPDIDNNGNGIFDYEEKKYSDGRTALLAGDANEDGILDAYQADRDGDGIPDGEVYSVKMSFRNGETKCLKIRSRKGYDYLYEGSSDDRDGNGIPNYVEDDVDDLFMISYGPGDCINDTNSELNKVDENRVNYRLPDLGHVMKYEGETAADGTAYPTKIIYDLRINNVKISTENSVLDIYIGFYHPDLGTRYAISIISPINY